MTRFSNIVFFLSLFVTHTAAFAPVAMPKIIKTSTTARKVLLSEEETAAMIDKAHNCAEGACSVDDVGDLISELKEQQHEMNLRLEEIMNMVAHLQKLNVAEARKTDEVRAYVRDLLRVFDHKSGHFSTGFSGFVGDGAKTAYDVLPPKPWKPKP